MVVDNSTRVVDSRRIRFLIATLSQDRSPYSTRLAGIFAGRYALLMVASPRLYPIAWTILAPRFASRIAAFLEWRSAWILAGHRSPADFPQRSTGPGHPDHRGPRRLSSLVIH